MKNSPKPAATTTSTSPVWPASCSTIGEREGGRGRGRKRGRGRDGGGRKREGVGVLLEGREKVLTHWDVQSAGNLSQRVSFHYSTVNLEINAVVKLIQVILTSQ